jgi:hypothetical protein
LSVSWVRMNYNAFCPPWGVLQYESGCKKWRMPQNKLMVSNSWLFIRDRLSVALWNSVVSHSQFSVLVTRFQDDRTFSILSLSFLFLRRDCRSHIHVWTSYLLCNYITGFLETRNGCHDERSFHHDAPPFIIKISVYKCWAIQIPWRRIFLEKLTLCSA